MAGVAVKLYADVNGNGKIDAADGPAVVTKVTGSTGD